MPKGHSTECYKYTSYFHSYLFCITNRLLEVRTSSRTSMDKCFREGSLGFP